MCSRPQLLPENRERITGDGHAMMDFAPARTQQERFVEFAAVHLDVLRRVLREAADAKHRQAAAMVIAYAADKQGIIDDLVAAASDADATAFYFLSDYFGTGL